MHMVKCTVDNGKMVISMERVFLNIHPVELISINGKGAKYDGE